MSEYVSKYGDEVHFASLLGATLTEITGCEKDSDQVTFHAADGRRWRMYHRQDCCESVSLDDIAGDVSDLIGSPLTMAEEVTSDKNPEGVQREYQQSFTWTFYKMATVKGYVTLRWYGESNGYYSESVMFVKSFPLRKDSE